MFWVDLHVMPILHYQQSYQPTGKCHYVIYFNNNDLKPLDGLYFFLLWIQCEWIFLLKSTYFFFQNIVYAWAWNGLVFNNSIIIYASFVPQQRLEISQKLLLLLNLNNKINLVLWIYNTKITSFLPISSGFWIIGEHESVPSSTYLLGVPWIKIALMLH